MIIILTLMALGIVVGVFASKWTKAVQLVERLTNWSIYLLLFLLGIGVGLNEKIINNIHSLGLQALVLTLGALAGSLLLAFLTYNLFFRNKQ